MPQKIENARERLLEKGKALLTDSSNTDGDLNIRDLTAACGMSPGTFYHYFKNKDDLERQILKRDWIQLLDSLEPVLYGKGHLYDKVRALYEKIDVFYSTYHYSVILRLDATEENLANWKENMDKVYAYVQSFLAFEVEKGELCLSADLDSAAYLLVQLMIATSRHPAMTFDQLWSCMNFRDASD
jgi:AcrR family transcriptional regulator